MERGAARDKARWGVDEIDAYLLDLGRIALSRLDTAGLERFRAAVKQERYTRGDLPALTQWAGIAAQGPDAIAQALTMETNVGRRLRRAAPFDAIVKRDQREETLRRVALQSPNAWFWQDRWAAKMPKPGFPNALVERLRAAVGERGQDEFSRFVSCSGATKWIVAADFCIGDPGRFNDAFAYTVFPCDAQFDAIQDEIRAVLPRDIKRTKAVSAEMLEYLRSGRRFTFAFALDRSRRIFPNVRSAREAIDETLVIMRAWRDAEKQAATIKRVEMLRRKADSPGFNVRRLDDVTLAAAFAGFIALLLQLEGRSELIGWFPDRDDITSVWQALAYEIFGQNTSAFALRERVPEARIACGVPGPREDGTRGMWFDELLRVPDFVAGTTAAWRLSTNAVVAGGERFAEIIRNSFADNERLVVIKVDVSAESVSASRVLVSRRPFSPQMNLLGTAGGFAH